MPTISLGGAQYFVAVIDDYSRKVWAYLLQKKDQVLLIGQHFVIMAIQTQARKRVKFLHSSNGGEYLSKYFQEFFDTKVIKRKLFAPYIPCENGIAESA